MRFIWNTVMPGQFSHKSENKDNPLQMKGVFMIFLELKDSAGMDWNVH